MCAPQPGDGKHRHQNHINTQGLPSLWGQSHIIAVELFILFFIPIIIYILWVHNVPFISQTDWNILSRMLWDWGDLTLQPEGMEDVIHDGLFGHQIKASPDTYRVWIIFIFVCKSHVSNIWDTHTHTDTHTNLEQFHQAAQSFDRGFGHGPLHWHVHVHGGSDYGAEAVCIQDTLQGAQNRKETISEVILFIYIYNLYIYTPLHTRIFK